MVIFYMPIKIVFEGKPLKCVHVIVFCYGLMRGGESINIFPKCFPAHLANNWIGMYNSVYKNKPKGKPVVENKPRVKPVVGNKPKVKPVNKPKVIKNSRVSISEGIGFYLSCGIVDLVSTVDIQSCFRECLKNENANRSVPH